MTKNWPNDVRVGCKAPFTLVELINFEINLKEGLDKIEVSFEQKNWMMINLKMFALVMKFVGFFGHIKAFNYFKIKINFKKPTKYN